MHSAQYTHHSHISNVLCSVKHYELLLILRANSIILDDISPKPRNCSACTSLPSHTSLKYTLHEFISNCHLNRNASENTLFPIQKCYLMMLQLNLKSYRVGFLLLLVSFTAFHRHFVSFTLYFISFYFI